VAIIVCRLFDLHPASIVALVTLSMTPVGALFPQGMLPLLRTERGAHAHGLFVATTLLSVVLTPLAIEVINVLYGEDLHLSPLTVINVAVGSLLLPLGMGLVTQTATCEANAPYLTVMLEGKYTDAYLRKAGKDAPKFTDDDLKVINSPLDFVGINVYRPMNYLVASDEAPGWREIQFSKAHPKMVARWHAFDPVALYWAPKFVHSLWGPKEIHITENGCATDDELTADGNIFDTDRIMFLRAYLTQLQRATAEGVPVKGYFQWSTMDNFEWNAGLSGNRYGLVYVDFKTQKRAPKASAAWFREVARRNAVV
jgi:beta-glucosidase